jgi:hypothetical protein
MSGWYAIASSGSRTPSFDAAQAVASVAAIETWRYSQGIYRFDKTLFDALIRSDIKGEIPSDVLFRLPEWCLYVETPEQSFGSTKLEGFWVHLEWDVNREAAELRFLFNAEEELVPAILHIGPWTVEDGVQRVFDAAMTNAQAAVIYDEQPPAKAIAEILGPMLSLVLYLCSEEPEIDDLREPGVSPSYAVPTKTKKGLRFFPPSTPRVWVVGSDIGEKLRDSRKTAGTDEPHNSPAPHIRRAHWHGYWTGPKTGERRFVYRWIPPLVVGGNG